VGVYSNIEIRQAIKDGRILCEPFVPKHVAHASLDVTLGNYYYRTERSKDHPVYNPFDEDDVKRYFEGVLRAVPHKKRCQENGVMMLKGIPPAHPVIPVRPGERILTHTHEFFGILPPGACEVRARSSWGRNGVAVSFDAGWIDPGYINRLTLEVFNLNHNEIILLPVGERIAQIIFHHTGEVDGNYGAGRNKGFSGKYQSGTDIKDLIKNWRPELMLPRAYLDKRVSPKPIRGLKAQ
jgi:deoxycytidine triphosphate deaminase